MAQPVEQEKPTVPEGIAEIPRAPEIPEHIEKSGVSITQQQVTTQVTDDAGKPLTKSPATDDTTVTIPADTPTLTGWSKGKIGSSMTWLGVFWLRMVKKAKALGKGVSVNRKSDGN